MAKSRIEDKIVQGLEEFAGALERGEDVTNLYTCRKIVLDLQPSTYGPNDVKRTRQLLGVSQALFATFLGVALSTIRAWERGAKGPNPMACRFMDEIRHAPERFRARFLERASLKRGK